MSRAVSEGALTALAALLAHASDRARMQVASHAWKVASDHFAEIDFFRTSDQLLRETDPDAVVRQLDTLPAQVARVAAEHGAAVDSAALQERILRLTPNRIASAYGLVQSEGTQAAFERVTQWFTHAAGEPRAAGARIVTNENEDCQELAMIESTLWILAGLYSLACAVTLGICVACCVAAAILSIAAGAVGLIGAYMDC